MFKIFPQTKIYVFSPSNFSTGGVEALHNLVHCLRLMGHDAQIFYIPQMRFPTPWDLSGYFVKRAVDVEDHQKNILMVPEVWTHKLRDYESIQKAIWWLSVDNHFVSEKETPFDFSDEKNFSVIHLAQSRYSEDFLRRQNAKYIMRLCSSLNRIFYKQPGKGRRFDRVLYNPQKGYDLTKRLIAEGSSLQWIAIDKLKRKEVQKLMATSKVYVDFGPHPGRDRMPREAVLNGCCVIVGLRGTASYLEDMPLKDDYRFPVDSFSPKDIVGRIKDCLVYYEKSRADFEPFRRLVMGEPARFYAGIMQIFGKRDILVRSKIRLGMIFVWSYKALYAARFLYQRYVR
jgi:hypothetical protein